MVALNFKPEFSLAVETGRKRQTIRLPRKDGRDPKPGDALQLYTGMRQRTCRKLREAKCTNIEAIQIYRNMIVLAGRELGHQEASDFAKADGFGSFGDMTNWFHKTHGLPFAGLLIQWG